MVFDACKAKKGAHRRRMFLVVNVLLFVFLIGFGLTDASFPAKDNVKHAKASHVSIHVNVELDGMAAVQRPVIQIMPLGDSITVGEKSTGKGGYRVTLWNDCKKQGWHVEFVGSRAYGPASLGDRYNEGHSGWRIDQISAHVTNWLASYQPQVILLHIGTNDIIQHYSTEVVVNRLRLLLHQITTLEPDVVLLVAQIIPLRKPALNAEVKQYNSAIPGLVHELDVQGRNVQYVNMYNAVPVTALADGIHPNDTGYGLLANTWFKALQTVL